MTVIRVEDLSLTPPERVCATSIPAGTSGVVNDSTSNQIPKVRRRKDIRPPQDEDNLQKQLTPRTAERSQSQLQEQHASQERERIARLSPRSAKDRRLRRAEKEQERLAKLTLKAAEQLRQLRSTLRQMPPRQRMLKKRKLTSDHAARKQLSAKCSSRSKKIHLRNRK